MHDDTQMRLLLFIILVGIGTACSQRQNPTPLDNCSSTDPWTLKELNNEKVKFRVSFPDWQTELDFINGDTISITALDSVRYAELKKLRILTLMQYDTNIDIDKNFQAIKDALVTYTETGEITVKNYVGRYMIKEEYFERDTVTTFLTLLQTDKFAINIIARVTKDEGDKNLFCDFKQVLETVDFDEKTDDQIALAPTKCLRNGGGTSRY
jgi:hypothetical protein